MTCIYRAECMICYHEIPCSAYFEDNETFEDILAFINQYGICIRCYYKNKQLYNNHILRISIRKIDVVGMFKWLEASH